MSQQASQQSKLRPQDASRSAGKPGNAVSSQQPNMDPAEALRAKHARNKANTTRNWAKVENFLMEVEKAQGYAKSWALRERLEQGHVSLDDLKRR